MKKTNTDKSKKTSSVQDVKKAAAKAIIASLKDKENKLAIYDFVKEKKWKNLGCDSLQKFTEKFGEVPSYSTMQRIYKAVDFQQTYLPDTVIGNFNEGTLRTISGNKYNGIIKKRVARMMVNSGKSLNTLSAKDLDAFIEKAESKIKLSSQDKVAAFAFAKIMITNAHLDKIQKYFDKRDLNQEEHDVFLRIIGRRIVINLKKYV